MRVHRNNIENLLPFSIVGCLYIWSGANPYIGMAYCVVFAVGRLAHTYAYLGKRAMLRRNTYTVGFLAILLMGIHYVVSIAQRAL